MEITKDRLHLITGISALGFGIYCLMIGVLAFDHIEMTPILLFFCIGFGIVYVIFGIMALRTKAGQISSFIGIGVVIGSYWWIPSLPWFMWPMIIMPVFILALTFLTFYRFFSASKRR